MYLALIQWLRETAKLGRLLPQVVGDRLADEDLNPMQRDHLRGETQCVVTALKETADRLEAVLTASR